MTEEKVVGAKYVVTGDSWGQADVGTLVTLEYDDGSDIPRFTLPDGSTQWIPMQAVVKLIGYSEPSEDKVTPKFAVGDIVATNLHNWNIARRITAVDMEAREYTMEWADGSGVCQPTSPISFSSAEECLTYYKGEIPASKATEQPHITAEQFAAIKVGDKLKLRTDLVSGNDYGEYCNAEMADLAERGVTPEVARINTGGTVIAAAEDDFWHYTAEMIAEIIPAEPEFNCPELVAGQVYFMEKGFKWIFRYFPAGTTTQGYKWVGGRHTAINSTSGSLYTNPYGLIIDTKWRKATAEETARLEAAEKEHGYVPPLVNKIGTVIEAGKYYVLTGSTGRKYICKVESTDSEQEVFYKNTALVELAGWAAVTTDTEYTDLESTYGESAVPATEKQIALYEAAVALREARRAVKEAA